MLLRNEQLQIVESEPLIDDLLAEINESPDVDVTEEEVEDALAQMYYRSSVIVGKSMYNKAAYAMPEAASAVQEKGVKANFWAKFKEEFCKVATPEDNQKKLVEIIIDIISGIVPFSLFYKELVKVVLRFIIKHGVNAVCAV